MPPDPTPGSKHEVPRGFAIGQLVDKPSQTSSGSQTPPELGRQTVPIGSRRFPGHDPSIPRQSSAASHGPSAGRHTVPIGWSTLVGQFVLEPSQSSGASQGPEAARQSRPTLKMSSGHTVETPSQTSA